MTELMEMVGVKDRRKIVDITRKVCIIIIIDSGDS